MPRHSLRHKRGWRGALQRTWMELGKLAESWLSAVRIPKLARTGKFGPSGFFFHRARPAKVSRAAARRPSGGFSLARPTGPPRKPSEAVFVGRGERSGAVRALPFRRGECSAAFFDDNGGCNAHAAILRQQKRTGPFGPALLRRKQKPAFIPRASPGRCATHPAASG